MLLIQTAAVLTDSLRLLRSRSLFWLTLALSAVAAIALFGTYSFNEQGVRFLWMKTWENAALREGGPGPKAMLGWMFNSVFVKIWLAWGAMILAIISTSSILPDFLAGGAIELTLSKPVSRLRLFLLKVLGALLFVLLQSTVGVGLAYLLIGVKFGLWIHGMLWAIPLLTLQFFFLYSFSSLIAAITRSTLACVLGTVIFWFLIFIVQFASNQIDQAVAQARSMEQSAQRQVESFTQRAQKENRELTPAEKRRVDRGERQLKDSKSTIDTWGPWASRLNTAELFVPKTGDVQKIVANLAKAPTATEFMGLFNFQPQNIDEEEWQAMQTASDEGEKALRDISTLKSLGTSSLFSVTVFGLAILVFCRRDF